MSELAPTHPSLPLTGAGTLLLAALVASSACERGGTEGGRSTETPSADSANVNDSVPAVIDADWVASKFQAPPPPERKDWMREIEKDPMAALKQMDPAALQSGRNRPAATAGSNPEITEIRAEKPADYQPEQPLRGWPPRVGQLYPNLVLKDQTGQVCAISDFEGKVILLEVVGLTCKACHAFAGGNEPGKSRFRGIQPQPGLDSIERYATDYAKLSLEHPEIVFVQLVLYGMDGRSAPTEDDVRDWASHFGMDRRKNQV
ncbi:MAG: hypothetical protein KJN97_05195, partial [Deltaproteobacteria bacterium]|nr:hypothetical protein [Deltaproteobacteria bacterium]